MSRYVVQATWDDAAHLSEEAKAGLTRAYPPHEKDARMRGVPQLGAGAIYPVPESEIICDPFPIPQHWRQAYALDVGWNRTAALWAAVDSEHDVTYLTSEYYRSQAEPAVHAQAIRSRGEWIPGTIDPAARGRTQDDGKQLKASYVELGLNLTDANNAVESGLFETYQLLSSGRLKIFATLQNLRAEYRIYRRDEKGNVVKANDHLVDCLRYIVMTGRAIAAFKPLDRLPSATRMQVEYDPYARFREGPGPRGGGHAVDYDPYREFR